MGNVGPNLSAFIQDLPAGDYFWSVQAVDPSFAGSPFAAEGQFTVGLWLINPTRLPNGWFQFQFLARPNASYMVFGTTNLSLPVTNWMPVGILMPLGPDRFQYTDNTLPRPAQRYYLLRQQ